MNVLEIFAAVNRIGITKKINEHCSFKTLK